MKKAILVCLALAVLSCEQHVVHEWDDVEPGVHFLQVAQVLSGDQFKLEDGRIIKYLGIKTLPKDHPFFQESYQANTALLSRGGGKVFLKFSQTKQDTEGRYLAYVFCPVAAEQKICCFVNVELISFGYAMLEEDGVPDFKYQRKFLEAQEIAKQTKKGMWNTR